MLDKIIYSLFLLLIFLTSNVNSQTPADLELERELLFRKNKVYKEEKFFKKNLLDSIYRKWDEADKLITTGYYINGKRHGKWKELITNSSVYHFIESIYNYGLLSKQYECKHLTHKKTSPKVIEDYYIFGIKSQSYTNHQIKWNRRLFKKKKEEWVFKVKDKLIIEKKAMFWRSNGKKWKSLQTKVLFDDQGLDLGHRKNGVWRSWNKDGTLQKETWYNMGKKLREKLYDHGKLISDKKY